MDSNLNFAPRHRAVQRSRMASRRLGDLTQAVFRTARATLRPLKARL
ncbi:hypothetical protein [Azospirillum argentinense]